MTPSEQILEKYKKTETAVDALGREIIVRRLRSDEQTRIAEMTESNKDSVTTALFVAASVTRIDQLIVPFPQTRGQLDATIRLLDDDGFKAASEALGKLIGVRNKGTEDGVAAAKNSVETAG